DSPAEKAGVVAGDAIIAVDGEAVEGPRDLARTISRRAPGDTVTLKVWRDGREQEVKVELGRLRDDTPQETRTSGRSDSDSDEDYAQTRMLGMTLAPTDEVGLDGPGLAVVEVEPGSPAAERGIRVGDILLSAGGQDLASSSDLERGVEAADSEGRENVLLKMRSGENTRFVALPVDDSRS
ncbi:MAG: PDZ domain-containing protein, partial [Pseudomonadota bacterium]